MKHSVSSQFKHIWLICSDGSYRSVSVYEVIVSPFTMSATAAAPLGYGAIPVFADIEDDTFCLDVEAVKEKITDKTHAIIATNLFGHPAELRKLRDLWILTAFILLRTRLSAPCQRGARIQEQ